MIYYICRAFCFRKVFFFVKKYMEEVVKEAKATGYVKTLFGRKRYLPEINSSVMMMAKAAERAAINAPIQGTNADMVKVAMIAIDKLIENDYQGQVKMIMQVHDELVFEINTSLVKEFVELIKPIMENVIKLSVPVVVDAKAGENWEEMEKV